MAVGKVMTEHNRSSVSSNPRISSVLYWALDGECPTGDAQGMETRNSGDEDEEDAMWTTDSSQLVDSKFKSEQWNTYQFNTSLL